MVEETILVDPDAVLAQPLAVLAQARVGGARGDLSSGVGWCYFAFEIHVMVTVAVMDLSLIHI